MRQASRLRRSKRSFTSRKHKAVRHRRRSLQGGFLFGKSDCEKLFAMKGPRKWSDMQNVSMKTRLKYSICKRAQKALYKAYKASKTGSILKNKDGKVIQPGVVFDPLLKGLDKKTVQFAKAADLEAHKWLDAHGWTDKNIQQAKKIKEQRFKELVAVAT